MWSVGLLNAVVGFALFLLSTGVAQTCDVEFSPADVIVKYGDPVNVTCRTKRTDIRATGWEASVGATRQEGSNSAVWTVSSLTVWDAEPKCYINFRADPKQCDKPLNLIIYKLPSKVKITPQDSNTTMTEGRNYTLGCRIENIAPSKYLQVMWYKGDQLLHYDFFPEDSNARPVNKSINWTIQPRAVDSGTEYKCVAQLVFGQQTSQDVQDSFKATILADPDSERSKAARCVTTGIPMAVFVAALIALCVSRQ